MSGDAAAASVRSLRLGMPQLAFAGLSEGWLLRDCGHEHWKLLTAWMGRPVESLLDPLGERLYASFVACKVKGHLGAFSEGEELRVCSSLLPLSKNRVMSRHAISGGCGGSAMVEMISILLKRELPGKNTKLAACEVSFCGGEDATASAGNGLAASDKLIRSRRWEEYRGYRSGGAAPVERSCCYRPSPSLDFNGAKLLYFASYHEFVDRAEWMLELGSSPQLATSERELFYFGNLNAGDSLRVEFAGLEQEGAGLAHHARIFRGSDQLLMAEVFTWKTATGVSRHKA